MSDVEVVLRENFAEIVSDISLKWEQNGKCQPNSSTNKVKMKQHQEAIDAHCWDAEAVGRGWAYKEGATTWEWASGVLQVSPVWSHQKKVPKKSRQLLRKHLLLLRLVQILDRLKSRKTRISCRYKEQWGRAKPGSTEDSPLPTYNEVF